jgi:hypothetical protein
MAVLKASFSGTKSRRGTGIESVAASHGNEGLSAQKPRGKKACRLEVVFQTLSHAGRFKLLISQRGTSASGPTAYEITPEAFSKGRGEPWIEEPS